MPIASASYAPAHKVQGGAGDSYTPAALEAILHMTLQVEYAEVTASKTVTPSQLAQIIEVMLLCDQPLMIWGPPGLGKSDVCQQVAAACGYLYHDVRPMLMERIDLLGVPYVNQMNKTMWASPGFLPDQFSDQMHFINLEELPNAKPDMMSALYQLVLDRKCGEASLPAGARIIACGNRQKDRGGTHRMPAPLASRFVHVELESSIDDWLDWAVVNDIDPDIMFFLRFESGFLDNFNPKLEDPAFPCPRAWAALSKLKQRMSAFDVGVQRTVYRGTVGEAAANAFSAFLSIKEQLPHPRTVLLQPDTALVPELGSAKIAIASSLCKMADEFNMDAVCTYALRLDPEIGQFLVGQCLQRDASLQNSDGYTRWAELSRKQY